jgi:hypothetical protein
MMVGQHSGRLVLLLKGVRERMVWDEFGELGWNTVFNLTIHGQACESLRSSEF